MKIKKICAFLGALALMSMPVMSVSADEVRPEVYVTISDGSLVLTQAPVKVSDVDGDGSLTINDALTIAHEEYCPDGADGFGSENTDYGLSMTRLWGIENGGSYGYYVNDNSAWSLSDNVSDGDYINAFVYTDTVTWSDKYSYFDIKSVDAASENSVTLTLLCAGFDENWQPVQLPVTDAVITIDGEKTSYITDENGQVTVELSGKGVISAVSDTDILVPPVCVVYDSTADETTPETETSPAETTDISDTSAASETSSVSETSPSNSTDDSPATSDNFGFASISALAVTAIAAAAVSRKKHE